MKKIFSMVRQNKGSNNLMLTKIKVLIFLLSVFLVGSYKSVAQCNGSAGLYGPSGGLCQGQSGSVVLQGSDTGTSYIMYINGNISGSSFQGNGTVIEWPATVGHTYQVMGTSGNCSTYVSSIVTVTSRSPGTISFSTNGTPPFLCTGDPITLTPQGGSGYVWTAGVSGSGPGNVTVTPSSNTTYTLQGTESSCSTTVSYSLLVTVSPKVGAVTISGTPSTFCQGTVASSVYSASATNYSSFAWTITPAAGSIAVTSATQATVTWNSGYNGTAIIGVTAYSTNGCTFYTQSTKSVIVKPAPSQPTSNTSVSAYCGPVTISASGLLTNEVFKRYNALTGGTGTQFTSSFTTTTLTPGTYYYYLTKYNSSTTCESAPRLTVTVTINPLQTPGVTNPTITCGSVLLSPTGAGTNEVYKWYTVPTGGTAVAQGASYSPTLLATTTYHVSKYNTVTLCESARVTQTITVNPLPVPGNVGNQSYTCGSVSLSPTGAGTNEVYRWYIVASGGSHVAQGASYSPTLLATTTYYVSKRNTVTTCESARVTQVITINALPSPGNVGNQTVPCGTITLSPSGAGANEVYRWYVAATGGSPLYEAATYPTYLASNTTFHVSKRNTVTTCESARVAQTFTVTQVAVPGNVGNFSGTCGTFVLSPTGAGAGEVYRWYTVPSGGSYVGSGLTYSPVLTTTTTFHVSKRNSTGCESARVQQIITVNSLSNPIASNQTSTCGAVALTPSGAGAGEVYRWYAVASGGTPLAEGLSYTPNLLTTTTYYVSKRNNTTTCESARVTQVITITPLGVASASNTTASYNSSIVLSATGAVGGEQYKWYNNLNQNVGTGLTYSTPALSGAATFTYYVTRYNPTTLCETPYASKATLIVTLYTPDPLQPSGSTNTCGDRILTFGTVPTDVAWYWQGTNSTSQVTTNPISSNSTITLSSTGPFYIRAFAPILNSWSNSVQVSAQAATVDPSDLTLTSYNNSNTLVQATNSIRLMPGFSTTPGSTFTAKIATTPECNDYVNWNEETVYNETGTPISLSRSYSDGFGNGLQSQSKDYYSGKIFASQPLFNIYGMAVGSTLPAPIVEGSFMYKSRFATDAAGFAYKGDDFDARSGGVGEINNPSPVGTHSGTVGWYYSSNNNLEGQTPTTQFPYSRSYVEEGPDPITSTFAGPGDAYRMGSTHEVKSDRYLISTGELDHYYSLRAHFPGVNTSTPANLGYKYVSTDPNGKKAISFVDSDGRSVASAVVTGGTAPTFTYDYWSYTYYNDAGQVVATVEPKDVVIGNTAKPVCTEFKYDHLGQLIETSSPDEGTSRFVYAYNGNIRFSQNSVQLAVNKFSYTNYDYLGRLIESGEYTSNGTNPYVFEPHSTTTPATYSVLNIVNGVGFTNVSAKVDNVRCKEYTYIYYDEPDAGSPATQSYVNGQVSKTENENATTWYSYDEFGQLAWTKQTIVGFATKSVDYTYDYFGNVTQVVYQAGQPDKFYHHYEYDINQRLTNVFTSFDGTTKTLQTKYKYYLHGPLKRVELAGNLQGIDYVYTINGALKSINHSDVAKDPGLDGSNGFSADVFGELINYHDNDYTGAVYQTGSVSGTGMLDQFNGNIKSQSWFTPVDNPSTKKIYGYTYDNLYQLQNAQFGTLSGSAGSYAATLSTTIYNESIPGYDKNGNIQSLVRNNKGGTAIGNYGYVYEANTNRVDKINHNSSLLIDYAYNAIGKMTQQVEGTNTMNVVYNAYGLVKEVRNASSQLMVSYAYDDRGNKVKKISYTSGTPSKTTYYVSDASGNTMAIYEQTTASPVLVEIPVYGAGRVALYKPVPNAWFYEVTDQLGNVRAVIGPPKTDIYTATMETEFATAEDLQFINIAPRSTFVAANNTPGGNEVVRLNNARLAGPGISLKVAPGDVITIETWAYYEGGSGYSSTLPLATIVNAVAGAFGGVSGAPGDPGKIYTAFNSGLGGGFAGASGSGNDAVPAGYLNMIMFDNNLLANPGTLPMSAIPVTSAANFAKQKLTIGPITIPAPGVVYIYVNNNSNSANFVNFDDLKVTHLHSPYVAGADYYPFGLTMSDREITTEPYRFGYQGQYSEEESETGWNSFDLRMYDARFGRWLSPDPYGQFSSPYVAMGNNPVTNTDRDGGFTNPFGESLNVIPGFVAGPTSSIINGVAISTFALNEVVIMGAKGRTVAEAGLARVAYASTKVGGLTYKKGNDVRGKSAEFLFNDKCTDCVEAVMNIFRHTDPELYKEMTWDAGKGNRGGNVGVVKQNIENMGGKFRKEDPLPGDIIMYYSVEPTLKEGKVVMEEKGHIEMVMGVEKIHGKTYYESYGAGSGVVPRIMGKKNGNPWLFVGRDVSALGRGKYQGFWTPPVR